MLQVYKEWNGITMGLTIGIFTPIIDGSFLDEKPAVSLKRKEFKKTNILMGANKDEGMFFIFYYMADLFPKEEDVFINREDFERSITELNVYANPLQRKAIEFEYTNWLNPGDPIKNREEVSFSSIKEFHTIRSFTNSASHGPREQMYDCRVGCFSKDTL